MLKILIPTDGSLSALEAVKQVIQNHQQHGEPMHVHLINVQPRLPRDVTRFISSHDVHAYQEERAGKAVEGAIALLDKAGLQHSLHIGKGDIAEAIIACSRTLQCDLIVMGTARKTAIARFFEGSVINRVIAKADIPVEVIAKKPATLVERFGIPVGLGAGLILLWAITE